MHAFTGGLLRSAAAATRAISVPSTRLLYSTGAKAATTTAATPSAARSSTATTAAASPVSDPKSLFRQANFPDGGDAPASASIPVEDPSVAWSTSYAGISTVPFDKSITEILLAPIPDSDIEIKPDGMLYLPEIKYRRILNRAFGPGGWGLVPRGPHSVNERTLSREFALICLGRFVSQARGEQEFFKESGLATATEGAKSNALMRCCKDLGIASELWDPAFIHEFKAKHCKEAIVTNVSKGSKTKLWRRNDRTFGYPYKE